MDKWSDKVNIENGPELDEVEDYTEEEHRSAGVARHG
jgi:hypothetical protein